MSPQPKIRPPGLEPRAFDFTGPFNKAAKVTRRVIKDKARSNVGPERMGGCETGYNYFEISEISHHKKDILMAIISTKKVHWVGPLSF